MGISGEDEEKQQHFCHCSSPFYSAACVGSLLSVALLAASFVWSEFWRLLRLHGLIFRTDKAYLFIKLCRAYNDDFITIARNYAVTLSENERVNKALEVLTECEFATEGCSSNNHAALLFDLGAAYILAGNYPLGCSEELTARKIAAAQQMQRYGYEYPKEWETDYLERS